MSKKCHDSFTSDESVSKYMTRLDSLQLLLMDPKDNKVRYEGSQYLTTPETPVGLSTKYFYSPFPESLSNCKSIKLGLVRKATHS